jgi:hypothetical protein
MRGAQKRKAHMGHEMWWEGWEAWRWITNLIIDYSVFPLLF